MGGILWILLCFKRSLFAGCVCTCTAGRINKEGSKGAAALVFCGCANNTLFFVAFYDISLYIITPSPHTHINCKLQHPYLQSTSYPPPPLYSRPQINKEINMCCEYILASEIRTASLQGTVDLIPMCPLFRGSTVS